MISTFQLNNGIVLECQELTVKIYKDILKATYGESPNPKAFVLTVRDCLKQTINNVDVVDKLTIYDVLLLLTHLRIQSMGPVTTVNLAEENKQIKLDLRLDWIMEDLETFVVEKLPYVVEYNNIKIFFDTPILSKLLKPTKEEYLYFIKQIIIDDKIFYINTIEEAETIFNSLPVKCSTEFLKQFQTFVSEIVEIDYLKRYQVDNQKLLLLPTLETLIWYSKIIFNESLESFYNNLFYLSKYANISLKDIESCNPGEYTFYIKKLEEIAAQQESSNNSENQQQYHEEGDEMSPIEFS